MFYVNVALKIMVNLRSMKIDGGELNLVGTNLLIFNVLLATVQLLQSIIMPISFCIKCLKLPLESM